MIGLGLGLGIGIWYTIFAMRFTISLIGFSVFLAVIMQVPQWRHLRHEDARGVLVSLNSDESIYLARVQESLSDRPELSAEAFMGHDSVEGSQFALIERMYGNMFRFTGWNAAEVFRLMDSVAPVLLFFSVFFFLQLCGFRKEVAFGGAALFCLVQLYNLSRPIHMRASFFLMLWSLIGVTAAYHKKWWGVALGGLMLGLLVAVYVWSFMFAWAFWGALLLVAFMQSRKESGLCSWHFLFLTGLVGLVAAIPAIMQYMDLLSHPLYEYAQFRSGIHPSRLPESFVYSGLFIVMLAGLGITYRAHASTVKHFTPVIALVIASVVYMNQQVVHGQTFNFVSHGIFSLMLAAISVVLLACALRPRWLLLSIAAASVYIAAIAYDGRYVVNQWSVDDSSLADQHLSELFTELEGMRRARIMTDPHTSALIAGFTKHDVVYSVYLKNILLTHKEIALRYCLTQLPLRPEQRHIEGQHHLIYPDAVSAFKGSVREEEVALVKAACTELDLEPSLGLGVFEASHIVWNKAEQPEWNMRRLRTKLKLVSETDTWALYQISE
jgi:hypothetical protein